MINQRFSHGQRAFAMTALCLSTTVLGVSAQAQQTATEVEEEVPYPLLPNNGMYPSLGEYIGSFNVANLDYPTELPASMWNSSAVLQGPLTQDTALAYMEALKDFIEPDMRTLVENFQAWDAQEAGWYNMVWRGGGAPGEPENAMSGRETIMNTFTGQIVPNTSWHEDHRPEPKWTQNFGAVYYNDVAAFTLGQVFEDVYEPEANEMRFLNGSIVVKVEASTVQPDEWPWISGAREGSVLGDAAKWNVYRPTTQNQVDYRTAGDDEIVVLTNVVQTVHPFQLAIKVRDSFASPQTGWVYLGFVYDARSEGQGAWDRFTPAGLMWGNDPVDGDYTGEPPELMETWVNPDAPNFVDDTIGWEGRFAAPMDVAVRHNVQFLLGAETDGLGEVGPPPEDGVRVSSCLSCHGAAQTPIIDSFYPSPEGLKLPLDGGDEPIRLYWPGTPEWHRWFKNRPGDVPMSDDPRAIALDYDLSGTLAIAISKRDDLAERIILGTLNGH